MDKPARGREMRLQLPLPPSINHQYATVNGRRVLSRGGRAFKSLVQEEVVAWREQQPEAEALVALLQRHYLTLSITFYFVSALRRDLDGGLKIAQDALCEALGVHDNLVVEIHLKKRVDRQRPRIEVQLAALPAGSVDLGAEMPEPLPADQTAAAEARWSAHLTQKPKRRRRKQSSLEELTARYRWEP